MALYGCRQHHKKINEIGRYEAGDLEAHRADLDKSDFVTCDRPDSVEHIEAAKQLDRHDDLDEHLDRWVTEGLPYRQPWAS